VRQLAAETVTMAATVVVYVNRNLETAMRWRRRLASSRACAHSTRSAAPMCCAAAGRTDQSCTTR
jgi:hypothetical protein